MNKKIGIVALVSILVLSLTGCGNTTDQQSSGSQGSQSTPSSNTGTVSTAGTTATDDFLKTITAETAEAIGVCGADLTWYYKDNVLVIKGTGDMTDYDSASFEYTAPWRDYKDNIGWVIIDGGCTSIGHSAFFDLSQLSKVELPDTLKVIKDHTLGYNLKELTIPASVEEVGNTSKGSLETLTFLGDAPKVLDLSNSYIATINYSGSGFETYIEKYDSINWVKQ